MNHKRTEHRRAWQARKLATMTPGVGAIENMKQIVLSANGGDRATAYAMSNKIVPLSGGYLVTWIDDQRQNQWAIVDLAKGSVSKSGSLGVPCVDNHCGAALVLGEEHVHAVTGGHHTAFQHYRMALSQPGEWQHVATIEVQGTYPCVASDFQGRIHLVFRTPGDRWSLDYCRFQDEGWAPPQPLVRAEKPGYIYWTNGLTVGNDGVLHLVFGNTRVKENGALLYGASHIASHDGGRTWGDEKGCTLPLPSMASAIPLIVDEDCSDRVQSLSDQQAHDQPGPRNLNYQQIILSNPVVDPKGVLHVVLHNGLTGTADLMSYSTTKNWTAAPLTAAATHGDPKRRVHVQSSLCLTADGHLRAALMVEQTEESVWGAPGTSIVLVELRGDGTGARGNQVTIADAARAQWLPAQPQQGTALPERILPLLYTRGVNAGGFGNNENSVKTEVILCRF